MCQTVSKKQPIKNKIMSVFQHHIFFRISRWVHRGLWFFLILGFMVQPLFATELKTELLPQKMGQLLNMKKKAAGQLVLASEIFEHLNHRMDELRQEILEIQKQMKIVSFTNAIQSARIKHNLLLMGQIQVYVTNLDGKIKKLKATRAKLNFLYQLLEDDLKIIETVNHMETARLMTRVNETIHGNSWLDQTHLFEVEGMVLPEPRKIWRNLIIKKNKSTK